jgi:magnesium chelatase family protein
MLVAAMNPCPCGYLGDPGHTCQCKATQIHRYRSRISGPLLDRIDIHIEAPELAIDELRNAAKGEASQVIRARVASARERQRARFKQKHSRMPRVNARMSHAEIRQYCGLDEILGKRLQDSMKKLNLSARAYDRILKVARTIADLDESDAIQANHLMEAIQYRTLDRNLFL